MNPLSCINNQDNIGVSSCKKLPQLIVGMITTPKNFSLTPTDAATSAAWQAALLNPKASRIYLFPTAFTFENQSEEAVIATGTDGKRRLTRDGAYVFRLSFTENLELHKAIFTHKGFSGRVFFIDSEGKIIGTELSNGNFAGFTLDLLNPEKLMFNDGSNVSMTPVLVSLNDNRELDRSGAMVDGSFIRELIPLTTATLEIIGTPTATEIVVSVKSALDSVPVLGLVVADFTFLDANGDAQTISTATDANDEGIYTLTGAGLVAGTLNIVAAADLSVVGFEGVAVTVTI